MCSDPFSKLQGRLVYLVTTLLKENPRLGRLSNLRKGVRMQ
jgi:hypothetical protein